MLLLIPIMWNAKRPGNDMKQQGNNGKNGQAGEGFPASSGKSHKQGIEGHFTLVR